MAFKIAQNNFASQNSFLSLECDKIENNGCGMRNESFWCDLLIEIHLPNGWKSKMAHFLQKTIKNCTHDATKQRWNDRIESSSAVECKKPRTHIGPKSDEEKCVRKCVEYFDDDFFFCCCSQIVAVPKKMSIKILFSAVFLHSHTFVHQHKKK